MSKGKLWVRDATGLVRVASAFDFFIYNASSSGPIMYSMVWTAVFAFSQGGNIIAGMAIAMVLSLPLVATYAMLAASMPRSGGDYVYVSRILHPALAFAGSLGMWFGGAVLGIGLTCIYPFTETIAPGLHTLSALTGNPDFAKYAEFIVGRIPLTVLATAVIVLLTLAVALTTRGSYKFLNVVWGIAVVGSLIFLSILATSSHADFVNRFDNYMMSTGVENGYEWIMGQARSLGFEARPFSDLGLLLPMVGYSWGAVGWCFWGNYTAGEVKGAASPKRMISLMALPTLFDGAIIVAGIWLLIDKIGYDFLLAMQFLIMNKPEALPQAIISGGQFLWFVGLLAPNYPVLVLLIITLTAWGITLMPWYMAASRMLFAWSFDRIIPERFSNINERTGTPILTIVFISVIGFITALLIAFYKDYVFPMVAVSLSQGAVMVAIAMIAGMAFPFRKREMYEASPIAAYKLGRVPLIVITGAIGFVFMVIMLYSYTVGPLGFGYSALTMSALVAPWILGVVIYYVALFMRRKSGLDLALIFKEIPPE